MIGGSNKPRQASVLFRKSRRGTSSNFALLNRVFQLVRLECAVIPHARRTKATPGRRTPKLFGGQILVVAEIVLIRPHLPPKIIKVNFY